MKVGILPDIRGRDVFSVDEAASYWGVPAWYVRKLARLTIVPHIAIVKEPRFWRSHLTGVSCDAVQNLFVASEAFGKRSLLVDTLHFNDPRETRPGFIYFASDGHAVKIGFAIDVAERMKTLQTGNPRPITVLATIVGDVLTERRLHRYFVRVRLQGEWFRMTKTLVRFIEAAENYDKALATHFGFMRKVA